MPEFSEASLKRLETCDDRLQECLHKAIKKYDFTVLEGHRGREVQEEYFRTGKSRVSWPNSKHNESPSKAVDIAPYPIDWEDRERFIQLAGYILGIAAEKGYNMRYGGDWNSDGYTKDHKFSDLPHIEIIGD